MRSVQFRKHLLSAIATVTSGLRKVVNKIFAVAVDNFDTGWVVFVTTTTPTVKVDCARDLSLLRGRMSAREPTAPSSSTTAVLTCSLLNYLSPRLTTNAVPTRPLKIWHVFVMACVITTPVVNTVLVSSILIISD